MFNSSNASSDQLSQESLVIITSSSHEGLSYGKRRPTVALNGSLNKKLRVRSGSLEELSDSEFDVSANEEEKKSTELQDPKSIDLETQFSEVDTDLDSLNERNKGADMLELTDDESIHELPSSSRDFFDENNVEEMSMELIKMYSISLNAEGVSEFKKSSASLVLPKNTEKSTYLKSYAVRQKFITKYDLPPVLFLDQLESRTRNHISVCDAILTGEVSSLYYTMAKTVQKNSKRQVITNEELRDLNILKFTAGYFGSRRQAIVGMLILETYGEKLKRNKNPVISFWGPYDFSQYILAPEVLSYLCMDDFKLNNIEDAWDIMQTTIEFGTMVADLSPLEVYEIECEEESLRRLRLPQQYSSMSYRDDPRKKQDSNVG
ncbi:Rtc4 [Kluyveromyces lactis]|nr:Rtc4 [Kluyveromyces lactis]